jgi:iron complex outermembrane receptor protein
MARSLSSSSLFPSSVRLRTLAAAAAAFAGAWTPHAAWAQPSSSVVVITGRGNGHAGIAGFGDAAPARTPLQASAIGSAQLADAGIASIAGLTRLDAGLGDAYNAEGYWSQLSARGYVLDNRFNYRRDGLPINAETAIALDNKERIEVLKGTSGIQAGTSAPGGLVNLVVKRPHADAGPVRSATLGVRGHGSLLAAFDIGQRFGADGAVGLRLNAAAERLDPPQRHTEGRRHLLAVAADWRIGPDTLLQAEVENSRQRQPSVAGFSLLGDAVPDPKAIDPRLNLNHQPWRLPVDMSGTTASIRLQQRLSPQWTATLHAMQQRLKTDDGTAFPYGVYDPATYECPQWCDRYAPDGTFTYWEYLSRNERRTARNLQLMLAGEARTGTVVHRIETGVLLSRQRGRYEDQVFDIAGTGRIDGSLTTPPSAGFTDANTNRDDRSTEVFVRDAMQLAPAWQLWTGLRHTRLERAAERTSPASDGLRATRYTRDATTPWLALAWQALPKTMVYASWGKGLETDVAPNRARYTNAGQSLELSSRQVELGVKHGSDRVEAALTLFHIDRGQTADVGSCAASASCTRVLDGSARHRGVEAMGQYSTGAWSFSASALWLDAERRGSAQPGIDGTRPVNVPERSLRVGTEWNAGAWLEGLAISANLSAESDRVVLPYDSSITIDGWHRLDLGARWRTTLAGRPLVWRLGLDNATDRRAWKESPYQFGHAYLYPLPPRTWRASMQAAF